MTDIVDHKACQEKDLIISKNMNEIIETGFIGKGNERK
jgi:hypothetical protein